MAPMEMVSDIEKIASGRHEALDVAVVGEKAVDEFADGIGEQQRRTDDTQLRGVERPAFENRFLDHVETRAADVIETVTDRTGDETLEAEFPIQFMRAASSPAKGADGALFRKKERGFIRLFTLGVSEFKIVP